MSTQPETESQTGASTETGYQIFLKSQRFALTFAECLYTSFLYQLAPYTEAKDRLMVTKFTYTNNDDSFDAVMKNFIATMECNLEDSLVFRCSCKGGSFEEYRVNLLGDINEDFMKHVGQMVEYAVYALMEAIEKVDEPEAEVHPAMQMPDDQTHFIKKIANIQEVGRKSVHCLTFVDGTRFIMEADESERVDISEGDYAVYNYGQPMGFLSKNNVH